MKNFLASCLLALALVAAPASAAVVATTSWETDEYSAVIELTDENSVACIETSFIVNLRIDGELADTGCWTLGLDNDGNLVVLVTTSGGDEYTYFVEEFTTVEPEEL